MTGRERILRFLKYEPVDRLPFMPITMMFAADLFGRSYLDYVRDYRVLAGAQIFTAEKFEIDYVSVISDPGREAHSCGAAIHFFEDQPPSIDEGNALLSEKHRLSQLQTPDPAVAERMHDRLMALQQFKEQVSHEKLIEGWIEGPCAEAADLRGINALMLDFFDDQEFILDLFEFVTEMEINFAREQLKAGADLIGIGDAAASLVGPRIYEEFVWPYEKKMVEAIHEMGGMVRLHICGNTRSLLSGMGRLGCEIVDLDYMVSFGEARKAMGSDQVLLGNIDPVNVLMKGTPEEVHEALEHCYVEAGPHYIVGAGCEVPRGTPEENLEAMLEFARFKG